LFNWSCKTIFWWFFSFCLKKYHPSRVLTLVYQTFALGTMAILAYNEAKINTRKRNVAGYILFAASTLMLMVVSNLNNSKPLLFDFLIISFIHDWLLLIIVTGGFSYISRRRNWTFYWHMCNCCCFRSCRCPCSRRNGWRHGFHVSWIHAGYTPWNSFSNVLQSLYFLAFRKKLAISTHLRYLFLQSFFAGLAASGALTSALRLITKAAFDKSKDGPRKGVSMSLFSKKMRILYL